MKSWRLAFLWLSPHEPPQFAPWASPWLTLQSGLKAEVSCSSSSRSFRQKLIHTIWPWSGITTASKDTGKKHILHLPELLLYLLYQLALSSLWHCILPYQISHFLDSRHCRKLKRFWRLFNSLLMNLEITLELSKINNQPP